VIFVAIARVGAQPWTLWLVVDRGDGGRTGVAHFPEDDREGCAATLDREAASYVGRGVVNATTGWR